MNTPAAIHDQRQKMLVAKISYLREEKILAEMTINDPQVLGEVVVDLVKSIARCGQELSGYVEENLWRPFSPAFDSAVDGGGDEGGC